MLIVSAESRALVLDASAVVRLMCHDPAAERWAVQLGQTSMLPALIRRFHEAAEANAPSVTCWGTGSPQREFLHVDDLGEACVFALENWSPAPDELTYLNVGTGKDLSIRKLAEAVAQAI